MVSATITERVAAGERLLDECVPGWVERIDAERLDIARSHDCVIGQLFGAYLTGVEALGLRWRAGEQYGFLGPTVAGEAALTVAWRERVRERQAARELVPV